MNTGLFFNPRPEIAALRLVEVSLMDVRKEINFCRRVSLPVLGVVENMRLAVQIGIESSGGGRCFVSTFGSDHSFPLYLLFYSVLWPTCSSGWVSFFPGIKHEIVSTLFV